MEVGMVVRIYRGGAESRSQDLAEPPRRSDEALRVEGVEQGAELRTCGAVRD